MKTIALLLLGCLAVASSYRVTLEEDVPVHDGKTSSWVRGVKPNPSHELTLTVAMRVEDENLNQLETILYEVSDPKHKNYGNHLTIDEITEVLNVPTGNVETVRSWFLNNGASKVISNPNRDMLTVTMPIVYVEKALQTTIHTFTHSKRKAARLHRASSTYSLPHDIAKHVNLIGELLQFPALRSEGLNNLQGSGNWGNTCTNPTCSGFVTPQVLMQAYKFPNASAAAKGNSMAVAEFQGQGWAQADNQAFTAACHRDVEVAANVGGTGPPGVEASLDIEYIAAVSPEIPLTVVYSSQYSLLNWANEITSNSSSALVHSVSYGNDEVQQSGRAYMLSVNTAFMKAGTSGRSILFASGDQGVCGRSGCGFFKKRFKPDFPGGSPYCTVVGGTNFHGAGIGEEEVWSAGGGGFSDNFPIPSYQASAVAGFKAKGGLPKQSLWNNTGRGYPDIAALGGTKTPYCIVSGGQFNGVAGTSAACPTAAGIFAKLNGVRLSAGKKPLGFLNPFIYQVGEKGFNDVTVGSNPGGGLNKVGFTAVAGWDAASGFGSPNFEKLAKLV